MRKTSVLVAVIVGIWIVLIGGASPASAHRNGCHSAHSCPSDTGSYVCGDTGNSTYCGTAKATATRTAVSGSSATAATRARTTTRTAAAMASTGSHHALPLSLLGAALIGVGLPLRSARRAQRVSQSATRARRLLDAALSEPFAT